MPTLEMRTSERSALKRCVQQWYWQTVEGLTPLRPRNPLWFGSAVHEALAAWYQDGLARGPHPAETFDHFLDGNRSMIITNEEQEQEYVDARELGLAMLNGYVERYGQDPSWYVLATEKTFQVLLPRPAQTVFGFELPEIKGWLRYVGTWDGVFRDLETGEVWLMEHKTAASIQVSHLPLDDQAGSYWALANQLLRKWGVLSDREKIAGIRYNFLRKALPDTRPRNAEGLALNSATSKQHYLDSIAEQAPDLELTGKETMAALAELCEEHGVAAHGDVSKQQPAPLFERWPVYRSKGERKKMIRRIQDEALFAAAYRAGDLPITKTPDKQWCNYCAVKQLCEADERGDQMAVEELKEALFVSVNPYAAHEKKSAES